MKALAVVLVTASLAAAAAPAGPVLPIPDAAGFTRSCDAGLTAAREALDAVRKAKGPAVLRAWNRAEIALDEPNNASDLFSGNHPDKAMREAAEACSKRVTAFWTDAYQDEKLHARVKSVKPATPVEAKLVKDLLEAFEDTGVTLPPAKRARAKELLEKIEERRQAFERNANEDKTRVTFSAAEMEGLPESYLKARKPDADGNYVLGLDQPSVTPFLNNARSEAARERYYRARFRKGGEQNLKVLDELFTLRGELAALYGQPTFAHYVLRRRMAGTPDQVKRFLAEVHASLDPLDRAFTEELRAAKAADRGTPLEATRVNNWDVSYYREKLRRERYAVDQEKLRAYFPAQPSLQYVMLLASRLYGLRFVEEKAPVWHPDVRYFDVFDGNNYRGGLYVDLFPRDDKRAGAAAYGLHGSSRLEKRTALVALEANFDRAGFNQREIETLLHEFGHALHQLLADVDYVHHGVNGVKWDFVEAPSQMFEEWARREPTLALFKEVCADCPRLTGAEIGRLEEARRYGQASGVAFQWLLASFDMELALDPRPPLEVWKKLESGTPTGYVEGTMFPSAFAHIAGGYASGYYGYMWSRVIARDMLSRFGDDLMDPKVAARYRQAILARASSAEESAEVRDFLGREPSSAAFFKEITGK